ncbi:alpha/beta fold hydrolase [Halosolutus amylolyticus]|uniref:Alpha/beta fold hydrolase n=1 Tax=Halosolutus amylolyticus TaxID=2932267 RepID=A0ABD5PMK5_9EURY|nr:alpha/beta fold hydrolase [Halosolutus amylolyticus]
MDRDRLRSQAKRLVVWLVALGIVVVAGAVFYLGTPYHGTDASIASVQENPDVTVTQRGGTYVLEPTSDDMATEDGSTAGSDPAVGLVFYPGGRVHPDAYLTSLAPLASEADVTVVVPKMPLNLAVLDRGAASRYVSESSIETWYVGGHSLGGAMACRYAAANPASVDGVVLFASYCDRDVSGTDLDVLSVTGSADTVLDRDAYDANRGNLPADATVRELPLNHSQFGSYRGQPGDEPSGLDYDTAHDRLADVIVPWFVRGTDAETSSNRTAIASWDGGYRRIGP